MDTYKMQSVSVTFRELLCLLKLPDSASIHDLTIGGEVCDFANVEGDTEIYFEYDLAEQD